MLSDIQYYARGQVYYRADDRGDEGRSILKKQRPVLIVSNNIGLAASNIAIVVPLSSAPRRNDLCTQVVLDINGRTSYAMCEQMYCTSKDNLMRYIGTIRTSKMAEVDLALKAAIGNDEYMMSIREDHSDSHEEVTDDNDYAEETVLDSDIKSVEPQATNVEPISEINVNLEVDEEESKPKRKKRQLSDSQKLDIVIKFQDNTSASKAVKQKVAEECGYSNWNSLTTAAMRFKKKLGV